MPSITTNACPAFLVASALRRAGRGRPPGLRSRAYRQAVAVPMPNSAARTAKVSPLRRWVATSRGCTMSRGAAATAINSSASAQEQNEAASISSSPAVGRFVSYLLDCFRLAVEEEGKALLGWTNLTTASRYNAGVSMLGIWPILGIISSRHWAIPAAISFACGGPQR